MTLRTLLLSPIDAWFFRDGRPYNQGETNQTDVASLFPPPATTLVGAIRAALARKRGWSGMGRWICRTCCNRKGHSDDWCGSHCEGGSYGRDEACL